MNVERFFDLEKTICNRLIEAAEYPWDVAEMLCEYIYRVGKGLKKSLYREVERGIWIANSATVSDEARICAPVIIGRESRVGRHASISGGAVIGDGALVGNGSEIRTSILFDGARAAQNNYVNDSILGAGAVLGMGAIITSLSSGSGRITVCLGKDALICERERFGALVGDGALVGCSSILSAGSVVERGARVNPLVRASGFISAAKPDGKSRASLTAIICDML